MLIGKKILIGITGSIAAYKTILLARMLVKAGVEVKVIMTPSAAEFVSPLTLSTLSKNKVLLHLSDENTWANHVMLGRWADLFIIAPLSCNSLAKMAQGSCDNLLMATYLSSTCPILVAPAMDEDMWHHPSTKKNIRVLESYGNTVINVSTGELASGLYGEGRMAEAEDIMTFAEENFFREEDLKGKKALVTAGPTYESIDPVRFIGNHSSGKMGFALAEELYLRGATVCLVCGPTTQQTRYKGINIVKVISAQEMFSACDSIFTDMDIVIMAAAVADYKPSEVSLQKIKKSEDRLTIELVKTTDILKHFGQTKSSSQLLIGFALETENEKANAMEKLKTKNADLIILNSLKDEYSGFGKDTNKITIFEKDGNTIEYEAKAKSMVAKDIVELVIQKIP